jgi:Amt family ammonium transporter
MVVLITAGLRLLLPMRVSAAAEKVGLDISEHGETADHSVHEGSDVLEYPEEFVGQLGGFRIGHRQTPD